MIYITSVGADGVTAYRLWACCAAGWSACTYLLPPAVDVASEEGEETEGGRRESGEGGEGTAWRHTTSSSQESCKWLAEKNPNGRRRAAVVCCQAHLSPAPSSQGYRQGTAAGVYVLGTALTQDGNHPMPAQTTLFVCLAPVGG
ncbi:hypothetical protein NUW54_g13302 [Trametes sanguinea]|uniref:Uncharacterized protein n=1 Tax=Trametes sanguinea TaxID=158606 RepID=A0ACC1MNC2_9APHY|nr:hypothetical protein NUW54_g13302 [Trametes sanguinea]